MSYHVTATRWEYGWELHIDGVGTTQCERLDTAEEMVRDYLRLDGYWDADEADVNVRPALGGLEAELSSMREASAAAERAKRTAADTATRTTKTLRSSGLSVADTAYILGVSKGRVSQLTKR